MATYNCNACAETENGHAPCILEVSEMLGDVTVMFCPVSGDEMDWDRLPSEEGEGRHE